MAKPTPEQLQEDMEKGPLEAGQKVLACYLEPWGVWTTDRFEGVVRLINEDGTAAIDFDDKDTAERVPQKYAYRLEEEQALLPSSLKRTWSGRQPKQPDRLDLLKLGGTLQYDNRKRSSQTAQPLATSSKPKRRRKMLSSPSSVLRFESEEEEEDEEVEEATQGQMDCVRESELPSVRLLLRTPQPTGPAKPAEPAEESQARPRLWYEEEEKEEAAAGTQGRVDLVREFEPPSKRKLPPSGPAKPVKPAEPAEPEESQARLNLWREEQRLWREKGDRWRRQEAEEQARQEMERTDWLSSINGSWLRAMQSDQFDGNPDHAHEFDGNPNPRRNKCCDEWQWGLTLPLVFGRSPSELIEDNEDSDDGVEEEEE